MGKISVAAQLIEEIYYNGNIQASGRKLEYDDFFQYLTISAGAFLRLQFYEQVQLDDGVGDYLSSMLSMKMFDVQTKNGMSTVDQEIFVSPRNMGIFNVYPVIEGCGDGEEEPDYERQFLRVGPGTAGFYNRAKREDLGISTFTMRGVRPLLGTDEQRVFIEGIFSDDPDLEMPDSILMLAISEVLTKVLKVPGWVDVTDDSNPNIEQLKSKLSKK